MTSSVNNEQERQSRIFAGNFRRRLLEEQNKIFIATNAQYLNRLAHFLLRSYVQL